LAFLVLVRGGCLAEEILFFERNSHNHSGYGQYCLLIICRLAGFCPTFWPSLGTDMADGHLRSIDRSVVAARHALLRSCCRSERITDVFYL